ncbi:Gfo/Idh/MocA family oxidoreductase [uncultured Parabacteroides sp.]|uniref:Gfo/Idh/MocA family protein n=1 Tax=uncultured Parabacteroides sp. TaxID=512312 RepID=UPI00259252BD|nr:Gfo/Idh/MocA family oxidoreductase [uncultured Parabacteroides sp.]
MTTRRDFIRQAALLGAGLSMNPFFIKASSNSVGANDKIRVGLIGCKGMGYSDLQAFLRNPEVECIALADIDENVLNNRAAETEKLTGKKVKHLYKDWRKLIDNKDVDVVIIGTPDHWHCLQMVAACEAGKDVYCEKPLGNSIEECNIMVRAAEKYNRVVQVGQWQRSDPHWQDAMAFVHSGQLGKIRTVRVFSYQGWCPSIPVVADEPVPAGVDYDMWLGPAPKRPFNRNRFHFTFRWFWDYAGGLMTDWGVHLLDYALYGMNVTAPNSIMASGGKFGYPDDACETPDLLQTIYTFDDFTVMWDHAIGIDDGAYGRNHGLGFVGENGTLVIDRGGWEVIPEKVNGKARMEAVALNKAYGEGGLNLHVKNHLECIKSRNRNCNASIEIGAHIAKFSQLGNIAYRTGKKLLWDGTSFHDAEADKYLCKEYRAPWELPKI